MSNETPKKPKKKLNQFMQIVQQAAENKKNHEERVKEQADAAKSPPQMGRDTTSAFFAGFGRDPRPQMS